MTTPLALRTVPIPPGADGTLATVRLMRVLVQRAVTDPAVRDWAQEVAAGATANERVWNLAQWFPGHFLYQDDPRKVNGIILEDFLVDPRVAVRQVRAGQVVRGDCDDAALLVATAGTVVGLPATFRAVGFDGWIGPYSHVYTLLRVNGGRAILDVTRPAGVVPPRPDRVLEVEV